MRRTRSQNGKASSLICVSTKLDMPVETIFGGDLNCVFESADCAVILRADTSRTELRKVFDFQDVPELD